jgi:hypothetical protein
MKEFKTMIMTRAVHLTAIFLVVFLVSLNTAGIVPSSWMDSKLFVGLVILATFSAVRLSMDRNMWLPFLGPTVIPPSALVAKTPSEAAFTVPISTPSSATHVIYWAAESASGISEEPMNAYGNYANAGVVAATGGQAVLSVRCPGQYRVRGKILPRHVHYRFVRPDGIVSEVMTKKLTCV